MSQPKQEKKLLILYIDCSEKEFNDMKEDLWFLLGCITNYRFIVLNKRIESISLEDLRKLFDMKIADRNREGGPF